jgi:DNA-binding NarL/FixJ family response regulator
VAGGEGVKINFMINQTDELYIIELIRQGKANKEIGDIIHISEEAVKNRIHRLLRKYNCKNRVQLALLPTNVSQETTER